MGFTEIGVLLVRRPYLVGDGSLLRRRMMGAAGRVSFALFSLGIQEVGLVREFSFSQVVAMTSLSVMRLLGWRGLVRCMLWLGTPIVAGLRFMGYKRCLDGGRFKSWWVQRAWRGLATFLGSVYNGFGR